MKCLYYLDLYGKEPDLYYKGKIKVNTILGLVFTILHIILSLFYFLFKFIRMLERKDVNFMIHMHLVQKFLKYQLQMSNIMHHLLWEDI
jgi:hypothetical protein